MLHYETVDLKTVTLLRKLQDSPILQDYLLVGGTSLALQMGHRISIDLDLFAYSHPNFELVFNAISEIGTIRTGHRAKNILNLFIDNIKVDIVSYRYPFIDTPIVVDDLRLASMKDIAAMKLAAITGRGVRKDFIDLFVLLDVFSLSDMISFYTSKYPDGNQLLVFKSLTYFEDAEMEPMPVMLIPMNWQTVKARIIDEVKKILP